MKLFFMTILFAFASNAWGFACPSGLDHSKEAQKLHEWLERYKGQLTLKNCKVEITACDEQMPRGLASTLGEVYVVDAAGREAYLPLMIAEEDDPKIQTHLESTLKTLNYVKYDHYFEPDHGRTEVYRLDLKLYGNNGSLRFLDLGTYATRKKLNQPNGNESRWYNCGE